ncbi:Prominin-1-A [Nymphon striatum]|nr:Prominin-1-A [Nymphon striatum]
MIKTGLEVHRQILLKERDQYTELVDAAKADYHREKIDTADTKKLFRVVDGMIGDKRATAAKKPTSIPPEKLPNTFLEFFNDSRLGKRVCRLYNLRIAIHDNSTNCCISVISMYACNENMGKAIPLTHKTIMDNIDDSQAFINNTYSELMFIVEDSLDTTVDGLFNTLDTINDTLGVPVRDALNKAYETDKVFEMSYNVAAKAQVVLQDILTIVNKSELVQTDAAKELKPLVQQVTTALKAFTDQQCAGENVKFVEELCNYPGIIFSFADSFQAEDEFESIPSHVRDNTLDLRNGGTALEGRSIAFDSFQYYKAASWLFTTEYAAFYAVIKSTKDAKRTIDDILGKIEEYDGYRWYAGLFVCLMVSICVGFLFAGMCCGLVGQKAGALPTQRSLVSNAGGLSLMAAVGFMFLFASFLMIVTTAFFLAGAHGEAFVCDVMYNDIKLLDKIKDMTTEDLTDEPFIKDLKISDVLSECKDDKPAYVALGLQNYFNISEIKGLIDREKIDYEINTLKVNLTEIDVLPDNLESLLNTYAEGVNINFTDYIETLQTNILKVNISSYVDGLDSIVESIAGVINSDTTPVAAKTDLTQPLILLKENIHNVQIELRKIVPEITNLQKSLQSIIKHLLDLKDKIITGVMDVVRQPIIDYKDSLLKLVDDYIDYLETQNGFWFGLGWCLAFFIPALIFSVKLSRHYRKMQYTEFEGNDADADGSEEPEEEIEIVEADCDIRGTEVDNSWKYGAKKRKENNWGEMKPIHAYDNQTFHPDDQQPKSNRTTSHNKNKIYPLPPSYAEVME